MRFYVLMLARSWAQCLKIGAVTAGLALAPGDGDAQRSIPDDHLASPMRLRMNDGGTGSGAFIHAPFGWTYLVTAYHVLYRAGVLRGVGKDDTRQSSLQVTGYGRDPKETVELLLDIDLLRMSQTGRLASDASQDVAVLQIAAWKEIPNSAISKVTSVSGVRVKTIPKSGWAGLNIIDGFKKFEDVLISNRAVIFGYPTYVGQKGPHPQIDYSRPLLRSCIVAGKNYVTKRILIDCPVYGGNSGGPVIEIEELNAFQRGFRWIGLAIQWVPGFAPLSDEAESQVLLTNSGYSVVVPTDRILELLNGLDQNKQP